MDATNSQKNSMEEQLSQKPTSTEILIDGQVVGGYLVKPWSIVTCSAISPMLERIMNEFTRRKISFRDFFSEKKNKDGKTEVEILNITQLFFVVMPFTPEIISKTLKLSMDEVEKIPPDVALSIVLVIVRQNVDYLKNWFALIVASARTIKMLVD